MASTTAAPPLPASPTARSPTAVSPNMSARSSPRSSPKMKPPTPAPDTCAMILSWLRTAVPAILQSAGHRTRRAKSENPAQALATTLDDGVVLAELVSFLDPIRLPSTSVNRVVARNAMSLPSSQSPPTSASNVSNIDTRQMSLLYKNNTRRVVAAVKKILDDVRAYSGFPHRPAPGAVDAFLGDVSSSRPTQDLRPTIRLAELVIATAVYGPRHNEFRHSIWRFPSEATKSAFHVAMTTVGQAVALPPPVVLYVAGPPPPNMPAPGVLSPHALPLTSAMLSPPGRMHSPRPPLSPLHGHSPLPMSPRNAFIPDPLLNPRMPLSPGMPTSPHMPVPPHLYDPRNPASPLHGSPRHKLQPSYPVFGEAPIPSNVQPLRPPSGSSPSQQQQYSPRRSSSESPRRSSSASPRHSSSSRRTSSRSPRTSSTAQPKSSASPTSRPVSHAQPPRSDGGAVAPLTRSVAPDAKAAPLMDDGTAPPRGVTGIDDGMGGRKFSMVTDEESRSPPEVSSSALQNPQDLQGRDSSGDLRAVSSEARHVVESDIVQSMRALEEEHCIQPQASRYEDASVENEPGSKRSSDEFYTPNEESPSPSAVVVKATRAEALEGEDSANIPPTPSEEYTTSPPITSSYMDTKTSSYYRETKVDETVRQSVTTSITEHISKNASFGIDTVSARAEQEKKNAAPRLFRSESNTSSIDMRDASYLLSPSASDAPSPSNQWQISQQKGVGHDILSPRPLYSPPPMPPRQSRTAMSTQMTPPLGGTTEAQSAAELHQRQRESSVQQSSQAQAHLYGQDRANLSSPSLPEGHGLPPRPHMATKYAQAATQVPRQKSMQTYTPGSETQTHAGKSRVSFAPTITSPGGHTRPLGEPLKGGEEIEGNVNPPVSTSSTASFSLPPSAAGEEQDESEEDPGEMDEGLRSRGSSFHTAQERNDTLDEEHYDYEDDEQSDEVDGSQNRGEFAVDGDESYLEKDAFQKVEEYVVYNSDEERKRMEMQANMDADLADDHEEPDAQGSTEDPDDEGVFDEDEEYIEETSMALDDNERTEIEPAAEEEMHRRGVGDAGMESAMGRYDQSGSGMMHDAREYLGNEVSADRPEGFSHYVPGPMDFVTPPAAVRYSRQGRGISKEVPETPPSPPNLSMLMESISESKLTGVDEEEDDVDDGPVSTMEPSVGLFQKLIAVWQSADEQGQRPESLMASEKKEGTASHLLVPEMSVSPSSAQESTLKSGDTEGDVDSEKVLSPPVGETSSRSRRPRAMRLQSPNIDVNLADGVIVGNSEGDDKPERVEEGTAASFSDAFSSGDKGRQVQENGRVHSDAGEWEEAMKGDVRAGLPTLPDRSAATHTASGGTRNLAEVPVETDRRPTTTTTSTQNPQVMARRAMSGGKGVFTDGHHVKVDRRRLDWLTQELLAARDAISRSELQMTFAETQRLEQEEFLLLERQDAESIVGAMKKILAEREHELHDARNRLSVAIQTGPSGTGAGPSGTVRDRGSVESRSSNAGGNLEKLILEGHAKLHQRLDHCTEKQVETTQALGGEMRQLWSEVQRAMLERMSEMTERRDEELEVLRLELMNRERLIVELQQSSSDLADEHRAMQVEASELRIEKEKSAHDYELEMSHVTAQVELVNEFSKKLHDNFRETENLRQQVLQYQDKLSHITSTSGVSQRQIKELREAVTRANDECARLRREAELAEKKGMEAVRRAEELEELTYKDVGGGQSGGRYPDRQDSGSFRSHEPVRPAGQNRPGGSGVNARYHAQTRARGLAGGSTPAAQRAWLQIKTKIGAFVTGKEGGSSRRRGGGGHVHHRDGSQSGSVSQSSRSQSRSRLSRDDDGLGRSTRSAGSRSSNGSGSVGGSSVRSGPQRSNRSGSAAGIPRSPLSGGEESSDGGEGTGTGAGGSGEASGSYVQQGATYGKGEVGRIRATDF